MQEKRHREPTRTAEPARDAESVDTRAEGHASARRYPARLARKCFEMNRHRQAWLLGRDLR
ncbi:hypothetical protein SAMN04487820_10319 [Actinopolyspora mzabensis]|uniref:Uncharacterized protein n=1 Tax=Actinopolyspora mzabensis TaxID=995066 RepID=A0A1G8XQV2_ACTMZ|nr:hypothetical protein [Actinopolyspora mzabensis]SDJ92961.1 hypothetical protein SAMN04487820_10319 [Actinopolyspora mzabensis]